MFGKLREFFGYSAASKLELEALESLLGQSYASDYRTLLTGGYKNNESNAKRAAGLKYIASTMIETKQAFSNDEQHGYFWKDVIGPSIESRFKLTLFGEYDSAKFYVDAMDFRLSLRILMFAVDGENVSLPDAMIATVSALNLREVESGGYFGNTPYWTLHKHQSWGQLDRRFNSIQLFWFALLLADEASASATIKLVKLVDDQNIFDGVPDEADFEYRIAGSETSRLMHLIAVGVLHFSSLKFSGNKRADGLSDIAFRFNPGANQFFRKAISEKFMQSVSSLQSFLPDDHIISFLPNDSFTFNLAFQEMMMNFVGLLTMIDNMLETDESREFILGAKEVAPHLLNASSLLQI
jgi:hypothetical protein